MSRLEVRDLTVCFGRSTVLHAVTLPPLADGELLGLLGPNASGKTTCLRRLTRELGGTGRITLDGRSQADWPRSCWQARVAAVPQAPPQPSALRPVELLWSTARALDMPLPDRQLAARIESVLASLGLDEVALAPLHTLSGGKRQLVGIALALLRDPALLLLDEPTSALDLHWRLVVLDLLRARLAGGGVAVAALHDLELAARYCDRLALLDGGRVVASGRPAEVLTADTLAQVYRVEAEVHWQADGVPGIRVLRPLGT